MILKVACLGNDDTSSIGKNAFFQGYGFTQNGKIVFLGLFIQKHHRNNNCVNLSHKVK
jgi:hypothetical protein